MKTFRDLPACRNVSGFFFYKKFVPLNKKIMKRLILLFAISTSLLFSCNSTDPEPSFPDEEKNLVSYELDGVEQNPNITSFGWIDENLQFTALDNTNGIAITIMFDSLVGLGVYELPDSNLYDFNSLALTKDSKIYYSSQCKDHDNNNAMFEVLSIDYENKVISGTFSGKVGDYSIFGDSLEHLITNGTFTKIDYIN